MARLIYSRRALADLNGLADALLASDPAAASHVIELIIEGIQILQHHPFMGRAIDTGLFSLIISQGDTGHVALYSVEPEQDAILVLTVRHQRDSGYAEF